MFMCMCLNALHIAIEETKVTARSLHGMTQGEATRDIEISFQITTRFVTGALRFGVDTDLMLTPRKRQVRATGVFHVQCAKQNDNAIIISK